MRSLIINKASTAMRWLWVLIGAQIALLEPTVPYISICVFALFIDCYTAIRLSKRVAKYYPDLADGKPRSNKFGKVFHTLLLLMCLIILAFHMEQHIVSLPLTNIIAGAFCAYQIWSILENESSCNGASWAKVLQKIMVDKTARHFDVDLSELKEFKKLYDKENDDEKK